MPVDNLIALPVTKGPKSVEFDFTFEKRNSPIMIDALGFSIVQLSNSIPDGLVVFFPSYAYLDQVINRWQLKDQSKLERIWDRLGEKKPIFCESHGMTGPDDVLARYTESIACNKGGLLLSVIGGKMSEGINFSDGLGRGVVVVGLPYPNIKSAQWQAKLEYIKTKTVERTGSAEEGKGAAREHYENACMRAVNQSIGRAIRHTGDYASILLLDQRYNTPRIQGKLPGWIKQSLAKEGKNREFQDSIVKLKDFFASKKTC